MHLMKNAVRITEYSCNAYVTKLLGTQRNSVQRNFVMMNTALYIMYWRQPYSTCSHSQNRTGKKKKKKKKKKTLFQDAGQLTNF